VPVAQHSSPYSCQCEPATKCPDGLHPGLGSTAADHRWRMPRWGPSRSCGDPRRTWCCAPLLLRRGQSGCPGRAARTSGLPPGAGVTRLRAQLPSGPRHHARRKRTLRRAAREAPAEGLLAAGPRAATRCARREASDTTKNWQKSRRRATEVPQRSYKRSRARSCQPVQVVISWPPDIRAIDGGFV
jgi:hypothetical protein